MNYFRTSIIFKKKFKKISMPITELSFNQWSNQSVKILFLEKQFSSV
jgi:hypothetical protein